MIVAYNTTWLAAPVGVCGLAVGLTTGLAVPVGVCGLAVGLTTGVAQTIVGSK